jgi:hypothetical protein
VPFPSLIVWKQCSELQDGFDGTSVSVERRAALIGQTTCVRRVRLAAYFEFFEGGLELGNHEFEVFWRVGNGDFPILDGVGFVTEGVIAASQAEIGPKLFLRRALLIELKDLESAVIAPMSGGRMKWLGPQCKMVRRRGCSSTFSGSKPMGGWKLSHHMWDDPVERH